MIEIKITCNGNRTSPLANLLNFQGNLKKLDKKNFNKLKNLLLKRGFSFPVFVWDGNKILDGHQRIFVLKELIKNGDCFLSEEIPVCDIYADSKKEAAEKLLELQGNYGEITQDGLFDYINTFDIDIINIQENLRLPDIDINRFILKLSPDNKIDSSDESDIGFKYQVLVDCENEQDQINIIDNLKNMGLKCRPLIL